MDKQALSPSLLTQPLARKSKLLKLAATSLLLLAATIFSAVPSIIYATTALAANATPTSSANGSSNYPYQLKLYVKVTDSSGANLQGVTVSYAALSSNDGNTANNSSAPNNNNNTLTAQQQQVEKTLAQDEISAATNLPDPYGFYVLNIEQATTQGQLQLSKVIGTSQNLSNNGFGQGISGPNGVSSGNNPQSTNPATPLATFNKIFGWSGPQGTHSIQLNFTYAENTVNTRTGPRTVGSFTLMSAYEVQPIDATNNSNDSEQQMKPLSGSNVQLGPGAYQQNMPSTNVSPKSNTTFVMFWLILAGILGGKFALNWLGQAKIQWRSIAAATNTNLVPATATPVTMQAASVQIPTAPNTATATTSSDSSSNPNPSPRVSSRRSMPNRANQTGEANVTNTATTANNDNNGNNSIYQPPANNIQPVSSGSNQNPTSRQRPRPNRNMSPRSEVGVGGQSNNGNNNNNGGEL